MRVKEWERIGGRMMMEAMMIIKGKPIKKMEMMRTKILACLRKKKINIFI